MRIDNIHFRDELRSEALRRNRAFEQDSVSTPDALALVSQGWKPASKLGKYKTRIVRAKPLWASVEDRVWTVLYKMGFPYLCGEGGAILLQGDQPNSPKNQLDALAYDNETAIVVECKSMEQGKPKEDLQKDIALLSQHRTNVGQAMRSVKDATKRRVGAVLVLYGIQISEIDIERAKESHVVLLDADALEYYERMVEHTGEAARYQLLAEVFSDQEIDGLKVVLPAVEAKIGKSVAYTFAITPEHLLKLAFVAHRNRGELGEAGNNAYQRMVKKSRLASIRKFIDSGGTFPTNIVVNFNSAKSGSKADLRFEPTTQLEGALSSVRLGWLHLPRRYQSAWIIDGQHRLLAYSGHDTANKSFLSVTAYEGLEVSQQAELFTKINSEQKKVSGSLLTELYADLKWNSDSEVEQVQSIVSKVVMRMSSAVQSPFYRRILMADEEATFTRCISLKAIADKLSKI